MKDLKFGIIAILVILLIFFATLQIRITMMENGFQDKYLSLIVAVDLTRDRVKELAKRQSWSDVSAIRTQVGLLRYEVKKNRKKDLAYTNEVVGVRNENINLFYKLLKQIQEDARQNSWKERCRVDTLRVDVNNLETRLSNEINASTEYQAEWIMYHLRHISGKLAQIYYLMEEISGQELDIMVLNSKLVDKELNWLLPTCPK